LLRSDRCDRVKCYVLPIRFEPPIRFLFDSNTNGRFTGP